MLTEGVEEEGEGHCSMHPALHSLIEQKYHAHRLSIADVIVSQYCHLHELTFSLCNGSM